jgi:transposase
MRLDDPQWLRRRYVQDGASIRQMAAECAVKPDTMRAALDRAGIEVRPKGPWVHHPPQLRDTAFLRDAYLDRGMTIAAIAEDVGVTDSRVVRALADAGIPRRAHGGGRPCAAPELHDEAWLRRAYIEERRTLRAIGIELGCSTRPVWDALRRFGIKR